MICAIAGHKASAKTIWNDGTHFSTCSRCRLDLVEQEGRWTTPPPWLRVVWRRPEALEEGPAPPEESVLAGEPEPNAELEAQLEPAGEVDYKPEPLPSAMQAEDVSVAEAIEAPGGADRRSGRTRKSAAPMGIERRRGGDRRKRQKKQAIPRD